MAKNNTIRFTFIGAPVIAKDGILDEIDSKRTDGKMYRLHFGIKVDTSTEFVGLLDYPRDTLKTVDADFNPIEVTWADREDPDVLAKVARSRLYRTNVGCEDGKIKSFLSGYDFIKYLADVLPGNDKDLTVTGTCKVRYDSKGILRRNYDIQAVWYRRDTEKPQLAMSVPLTYWKDCVDKSDLKETGKININGYVLQFATKEEGDKYLPFSVVFDTTKYNMEIPKHKALYEYKMEFVDVKDKTPQTMLWDIRVVNGAQEVEFDESQLTKLQKMQIELGEATLDDFRPRGQIFGNRISELRLNKPLAQGDFADGMVDTGYKLSEFEDMIAVPTKDETVADMEKSAAKTEDTKPPFEDDLELF